ncbi:AAA family ATPase [Mycobacterium marinum]|uniref:bifunctional aminoglycoside phosphotransferase/ATP-binding protein n=1 Tax=Mycobacterium marinum TaxID=1781 RepID=UPI002358B06F|nr:bifunctional aminoglycoside phosphotransferase/ATP-binding protein [Mycobacterium marinum]MDC9004208.1 AAA family ATPase [Mycobacterium marinum]
MHETHTGVVVLVGERAYKAKKPVLTDFLDFRTAEQRERACAREVELNSRLAPTSYLGVAHCTDPTGGPAEPLVVMRRYHDSDRLAYQISSGGSDESVRALLDTIATVLARFHEGAERSPTINTAGEPAAIGRRFGDNLAELHRYAGTSFPDESIGRIEDLVAAFVSGRETLLAQRIAQGCIVDGHGDLLADDIFCAEGGPALLDCLEFDDRLRYVDRVDDAAFLAMDLEFLGRKDLGEYFLDRYLGHSGDVAPASLRDFYIAYRAVVRAKTDCVRLSQGKPEAAADAARHLELATRHLETGAVRLALVGGNPGTGKSTLARALAEQVGAQVISTDDVRKELRDRGDIHGESGVLDEGLYTRDNVTVVYDLVLSRARRCLQEGRSVILDGTWRDPQSRARAHQLGGQTHAALVELLCTLPVDMAADRIITRAPGNSEVTAEIAATMAAQHAGWDTALPMDTSRPIEFSLNEAHDAWCRAIYPE